MAPNVLPLFGIGKIRNLVARNSASSTDNIFNECWRMPFVLEQDIYGYDKGCHRILMINRLRYGGAGLLGAGITQARSVVSM